VVTRAGLPEGSFHEHFASTEECLQAAFDEGLRRLSEVVAEAVGREERWLARVRAGLVALLGFLDDEPRWGRLLLVDAPAGAELGCRRRVQALLGELLDEGRAQELAGDEPAGAAESTRAESAPSRELLSELVLGGVFSVIRERMTERDGSPLVELAPALVSFIVTSHLGRSAESTALAGAPPAAGGEPAGGPYPQPAELPIRATYRTACVLRAIASAPRSSNRQIAQAAGLADEGQTSKLLGRLEDRGLIENVGLGAVHGEPNAWLLTADGRRVVQAIGHGFALGAAVHGSRRVRGAA